ncbi:hypothetical protein [Actinoplanes subtropicus]|uniref:hypothetical protein n=1 Tax=Actinoplanes subtropicus TaxID=543632 RepID=UPI0004C304BF|nr:hypothetical protein [Actinoplanes subtropicus]
MTSLSDAERDASDVMQALAGLAALLRRPPGDLAGLEPGDPAYDQARHLLLGLTEDAGQACERVVAYLREQCAAGDGEVIAVPRRLGPWRDWTPDRGHLFGVSAGVRRANGVPQARRSDPGE